jgi:hypothetical protein
VTDRKPGTAVQDQERAFHTAMVEVFRRAKAEAGYSATIFIQMVSQNGGLAAARQLLHAPKASDGFTALWERGRLDLSVEAVVLKAEFAVLFTDEERELARSRLREYGYTPPDPSGQLSTWLVEEHPYSPGHHAPGTLSAQRRCSWHGRTCDRDVVASVLTRDNGGNAWHAVCRPALDALRRTAPPA